MKKLMKKKVSLLGKEVSVFAIVMVAMIGLASAALVPYLSGMVIGNVGVSSPMDMSIDIDGTLAVHGGEDASLTVTVENLADVNITGIVENLVTSAPVNGIEMTCEDFESVWATTTSTYLDEAEIPTSVLTGCPMVNDNPLVRNCGDWNLIDLGLCNIIGLNDAGETVIQFEYGPSPVTFMPGQVDVTTIVATFKPAAYGDYKFTSQVVPAN